MNPLLLSLQQLTLEAKQLCRPSAALALAQLLRVLKTPSGRFQIQLTTPSGRVFLRTPPGLLNPTMLMIVRLWTLQQDAFFEHVLKHGSIRVRKEVKSDDEEQDVQLELSKREAEHNLFHPRNPQSVRGKYGYVKSEFIANSESEEAGLSSSPSAPRDEPNNPDYVETDSIRPSPSRKTLSAKEWHEWQAFQRSKRDLPPPSGNTRPTFNIVQERNAELKRRRDIVTVSDESSESDDSSDDGNWDAAKILEVRKQILAWHEKHQRGNHSASAPGDSDFDRYKYDLLMKHLKYQYKQPDGSLKRGQMPSIPEQADALLTSVVLTRPSLGYVLTGLNASGPERLLKRSRLEATPSGPSITITAFRKARMRAMEIIKVTTSAVSVACPAAEDVKWGLTAPLEIPRTRTSFATAKVQAALMFSTATAVALNKTLRTTVVTMGWTRSCPSLVVVASNLGSANSDSSLTSGSAGSSSFSFSASAF